MKIEWKCPKCDAPHNKHGKGGKEQCHDVNSRTTAMGCQGFYCDCDFDFDCFDDETDHGMSFDKMCSNAVCDHCGWGGAFPVKPKGVAKWEKQALEAGWDPPAARAKELGIKPTKDNKIVRIQEEAELKGIKKAIAYVRDVPVLGVKHTHVARALEKECLKGEES